MKIKKIGFLFLLLSSFEIWGQTLKSIDACNLNLDIKKRQFIIGYGSLILEQSKRQTDDKVKQNNPIEVFGYERSWIEHSLDTHAGTTYLGIQKKAKAMFNGVYFEALSPQVILNFDKREQTYCRVKVNPIKIKSLNNTPLPQGEYWIYLSRHQENKPNKIHPIVQSYVDIFLKGCMEIEATFKIEGYAKTCVTTTTGWSNHWVNDRILPRRPHVYEPYAYKINRLLLDVLPEIYQQVKIE